MVDFAAIVEVLSTDTGFAKLLKGAEEQNSLISLGFDSLDVMMVTHTLGLEFNQELQITKTMTFTDILAQLNQVKHN